MTAKKLCILMISFLLSACSVVQEPVQWPEQMPARTSFVDVYLADTVNYEVQSEEDYLFWVRRFYDGVNLVPGWLGISEQVLDQLEGLQRLQAEVSLYSLGEKIGSEWSKDNSVRLLNSRSANIWREALIESLERGEIDNYLAILDDDVNSLLNGELENDDVYFERYYEDEF